MTEGLTQYLIEALVPTIEGVQVPTFVLYAALAFVPSVPCAVQVWPGWLIWPPSITVAIFS